MPWTQKQMLRDANGDLIPQYWDVAEQDFKPLTGQGGANDVRLTGSNVEKINITQEVGIIPAGGNKRININVPQRTKSISLYIRALAGRISSAHIEFRNLNPSYGSPINSIELTPVADLPSSAPVFKKEELVSDGVGIRIEADSGTDVELQFAIVYCWRD